ncbi:hypothetical protein RvY_01975 [Ramazzottius varieornatus]|uniref:Uncharacterized protein n=1 Tax=Ramazzottius varieornatus TaxID=947166 RepID=A0A1D1UI66_RAMVA|nr:hypothetical protein RvY_01975 [Ramazzottius varieornatus]
MAGRTLEFKDCTTPTTVLTVQRALDHVNIGNSRLPAAGTGTTRLENHTFRPIVKDRHVLTGLRKNWYTLCVLDGPVHGNLCLMSKRQLFLGRGSGVLYVTIPRQHSDS